MTLQFNTYLSIFWQLFKICDFPGKIKSDQISKETFKEKLLTQQEIISMKLTPEAINVSAKLIMQISAVKNNAAKFFR